MTVHAGVQGLVVIGAGPAGLAPLFAFASAGRLNELLDLGVTLLERGDVLGAGALGSYTIHSDSSAEALLDVVLRSEEPVLSDLRNHPVTQALAHFGKESAPLKLVGLFLELAGTALCKAVAASKKGRVIKGANALWVRQDDDGAWRIRYTDRSQQVQEVRCTNVVLATGAHQPLDRLRTELIAGEALLPKFSAKLMQSGQVLSEGGPEQVGRLVQDTPDPRVVIVGGSTSSAAVALALLTRVPNVQFREQGITLLYRKPLRIFYETAQEAIQEGYTEFSAEDVCPLTGRVYRLSGFRLDSRELIMKARGLAGRPPEPRLQLLKLDAANQAAARDALKDADLIVAALGYRPRLLPVFDRKMKAVGLLKPNAERWAVVNQSCNLLTEREEPLPGLFAIGLAVGPGASRQLGGEAGFKGQVNSLWLWQHTLGKIIAEQIVSRTQQQEVSSTTMRTSTYGFRSAPVEAFEKGRISAQAAGAR